MTKIIVMTAVALAVCGAVSFAQDEAPPSAASACSGLSDLNTVTFGCTKAALKAAALQAAKASSQGTYQFSSFIIDWMLPSGRCWVGRSTFIQPLSKK